VGSTPTARTTPDNHSEVDMPGKSDDLFGEDEDEAVRDFDRLTDLLFERVAEFAEEEDVADDIVPLLLLRLSLTMRMMTYAVPVANPSGNGLKLDLDRFRRDAEDLIRDMKKNADRFITQTKEAIAADEMGGTRPEHGSHARNSTLPRPRGTACNRWLLFAG
jgi:hypothetical protein